MKGAELIIRPQGYSKIAPIFWKMLICGACIYVNLTQILFFSVPGEGPASASKQNYGLVQSSVCCGG